MALMLLDPFKRDEGQPACAYGEKKNELEYHLERVHKHEGRFSSLLGHAHCAAGGVLI